RQTIERLVIAAKRHDLGQNRSFADWREVIEDLLTTAAWGLLTPFDSAEYQLLNRWNVLLNELSSLNSIAGQTVFSPVLERLQHLAATMLFTLQTKHAPVQILGASESAGIVFDSVWWMNTQASAWPQRGHVQPFLPWSVQRASHMPYADPAEDHAFALRVTERILASAGTVIVSFALQENDPATASTHTPSPEIAVSRVVRNALSDTPLVPVEEFLAEQTGIEIRPAASLDSSAWDSSPVLNTIDAEPAVPRQPGRVSGGVAFRKHQAACPFRAFAELRLGTELLAEPEQGLSAAERGNIMHKVLQDFWKEVVSQEKLLGYTDEECRQVLHGHIRTALRSFLEYAEESWQTSLLEIEAERLEARLWEWLEVEKQRPTFTMLKTEDMLEGMHLGGVELRCRIDRIDRVEHGIVLMDYKTGPVDAKACEGDRPDEPQLPAYAVLRQSSLPTEEPLAGIAFAGLHARNVGFTVVRSLPGMFPASPATLKNKQAGMSPEEMEQQQEAWGATLTRLAEEFQMGTAIVDPKYGNKTCRYCAQTLLCRVRETDQALEGSIEEEDPDAADINGLQGLDK
ncbi:MAG: PD-(D/E)XK nuclease family protein, partial [Acidobacteriaceae bacterium]